ncbi:hypothetical protein [Gordonia sp. OPL2]|uniref:hypothetical protein n=1 Tax=Gordonia sp. OPL2 TaxID=2486274 RepID=UPI001655A916|nr:hypothetical protein [Gordonia sp. OPL2]ROZ88978.1 hypothetical protein EEB19_19910 [Gordonia sp. OPL2]
MKKLLTTLAATAAVALGISGPPANASPAFPTAGDRIVYVFISDVQFNGSSHWFDENSEIDSFDSTQLPDYSGGRWSGVQRVTSASSYQSTVSTFQTEGYYAGCEIWVNGVQVASDSATGRYAVVSCY